MRAGMMMSRHPSWGNRSWRRLSECDPLLIEIFNEVADTQECSIYCGHRGRLDQNVAFESGFSKLKWPNGQHNKLPSVAVDVAPYPLEKDSRRQREQFYFLAGIVTEVAKRLDIYVRWGGDWDRDHDFDDQTFDDLFHWELERTPT